MFLLKSRLSFQMRLGMQQQQRSCLQVYMYFLFYSWDNSSNTDTEWRVHDLLSMLYWRKDLACMSRRLEIMVGAFMVTWTPAG